MINYDAYKAIGGRSVADLRGAESLDPSSVLISGVFELEHASGLVTVYRAAGASSIRLGWNPAETDVHVNMDGGTRSQVIVESQDYYERHTPLDRRRGAAQAKLGNARIVELSSGGRLRVGTDFYRVTPQPRDRVDLGQDELNSIATRSFVDRVANDEAEAERVIVGMGALFELPEQDAILLARLALNPTVEIP